MNGWLLKKITIEGFRGINNENDPLQIELKPNKINSVFAPNGIGKTSIFDALTYALTGNIPKLDELPAAENGESYYLNRFHNGGVGTIALTLTPDGPGNDVTVTITRQSNGDRSVSTNDGSDGETLLAELNREFVLLDAKTFQKFIDEKPLTRGRSFAGLLGLGNYSTFRQTLKAASNTRAFNGHFGLPGHIAERLRATTSLNAAKSQMTDAYLQLTGEKYDSNIDAENIEEKIHGALSNITLIKHHCDGKTFNQINPDDCLETIKEAEGGPDRDKLSELIQKEAKLTASIEQLPKQSYLDQIIAIAKKRDEAITHTQGDQFLKLYKLAGSIINDVAWEDKNICPVCDHRNENSLSPLVDSKIAHYDTVTTATDELENCWSSQPWDEIENLETLVPSKDESVSIDIAEKMIETGKFNEPFAKKIKLYLTDLAATATSELKSTREEKEKLEQKLPPSLVSVTEKVEAARRLQAAFTQIEQTIAALKIVEAQIQRIERIKTFLDKASSIFSAAETAAASRRLAAVEPICQSFFKDIVHQQVIPAISKPAGSEDLSIALADFYSLPGISAPAVLSESFRNAFAISVYIAAASLYGGSAKFIVFDDITSSFDAGHQFFLMEIIRTRFARPGLATGPQVIFLSHDTLLEKYFNSQMNAGSWWHQRIEGNPRTAVLPQNNAISRIRDRTIDLLNAGNTADAAPRIRQYLEFKLEEIISKCRIPVPIDIALSDDKHMCSNLLSAIDSAIKLHQAANQLVLESVQIQSLNTTATTIMSNYLSHWNTGQTQAFAPPVLLGVMQVIDNYAECFKFEPTPGQPRRYYYSLSKKT